MKVSMLNLTPVMRKQLTFDKFILDSHVFERIYF